MVYEYEELYVPQYPYHRCAHVLLSADNAPGNALVRVAVETETGWDIHLQLSVGVNWHSNPFSCQSTPPQVSETSARAYVEHGTLPLELVDLPRNAPSLIERETLRHGAMGRLAEALRARGVEVAFERHDYGYAPLGGLTMQLSSTFDGQIDRHRTDSIALTWKIGEEALPAEIDNLADQIAAVAMLGPTPPSKALQTDIENMRALARRCARSMEEQSRGFFTARALGGGG